MKKIILLILLGLPVLASAAENDVSVLSEDDTGKTYYRKFLLTPAAESLLGEPTAADMRDFLGLGTAAEAEVGDFAPAIVPWAALSGVPTASTGTNGVVQIATNTEANTGTDSSKAIVPSALANWWSTRKSSTETISAQWNFNSRILLATGSSNGVSVGETTTGLYQLTAGTLSFRANNALYFNLTGDRVQFNTPVTLRFLNLGTAGVPVLANNTDTDTGIYWSGADALDFATGGVRRGGFTASGGFETTGSATLQGTSNTAPNQTAASGAHLMTRDLVRTEGQINNFPFTTSAWTQTAASGTGSAIQADVSRVRLDAASTSGSGAITASFPLDMFIGLSTGTNFGAVNFGTALRFSFRIISAGNGGVFEPANQNWAISLGVFDSTPTSDITTLYPASGASSARGYYALRCINGAVQLVAQSGTSSSVASSTLETITGSFARQYTIEMSGGTAYLWSGRTLLGSVSGGPTTSLQATLYANHSASASASITQRRINIMQPIISW